MHFSSTLALSGLLTLAQSAALTSRALSGQATFYGGNVAGGACSFSTYTLPSGIFGTALSDSNWANSANCGACVSVTGPSGNSITAMIVDECPGCGTNHLDLFPDAFTKLAPQVDGIIAVTWDYVDCGINSPLQLHNKEGVSAYWFSMQVVNANQRIAKLEVSSNGGSTWVSTTRQTYNFFEISSGTGSSTVDVKITSVNGAVVIVKSVTISSGTSVTASSNFGSSSSVKADAVAVSSLSSVSTSMVVAPVAPASSSSKALVLPIATAAAAIVASVASAASVAPISSSSASPIFASSTAAAAAVTLVSATTSELPVLSSVSSIPEITSSAIFVPASSSSFVALSSTAILPVSVAEVSALASSTPSSSSSISVSGLIGIETFASGLVVAPSTTLASMIASTATPEAETVTVFNCPTIATAAFAFVPVVTTTIYTAC